MPALSSYEGAKEVKRYQIALIFFSVGIFSATLFGVRVLNKASDQIVVVQKTKTPVEYKTVKIFFSSTFKDPDTIYCDRTYPVDRAVSRLSNNERIGLAEYSYLAIAELLKGPAVYEQEGGYFTTINEGTKVQNIAIENGIATIDFNDKLIEGVAGACKVQAIRSQITETLMQFPEIHGVIITVNGISDVILQP